MATSLGGAKQAGVRLMVKNSSASTIVRGRVVSWSSVAASNPAASFLDGTRNKDFGTGTVRETDIPYISVILGIADTATPGGASRLGVTAADIPAGGYGEIICFGPAYVDFPASAAITVGEVVTCNSSGQGLDAANASHDNPIGLLLETVDTTAGLRLVFVNCLGAAGASSTAFLGKAY